MRSSGQDPLGDPVHGQQQDVLGVGAVHGCVGVAVAGAAAAPSRPMLTPAVGRWTGSWFPSRRVHGGRAHAGSTSAAWCPWKRPVNSMRIPTGETPCGSPAVAGAIKPGDDGIPRQNRRCGSFWSLSPTTTRFGGCSAVGPAGTDAVTVHVTGPRCAVARPIHHDALVEGGRRALADARGHVARPRRSVRSCGWPSPCWRWRCSAPGCCSRRFVTARRRRTLVVEARPTGGAPRTRRRSRSVDVRTGLFWTASLRRKHRTPTHSRCLVKHPAGGR